MIAVQLQRQAASLGDTAMVLAAFPTRGTPPAASRPATATSPSRSRSSGRSAAARLAAGAIRGGPLPPGDALRGTWTVVALGPYLNAGFVARDGGRLPLAVSYDRETVTECALMLMARMEPLPA